MLQSWEEYLENICSQYKPLGHLTNTRHAWLPYGSEQPAPGKAKLKPHYVKHIDFEASGSQQTEWKYTSVLQILVNVNTGTGLVEEKIIHARRLSLKTAQAIDARLLLDYENNESCLIMNSLGEPDLKPVDLTDLSAYGWEMTITFSGYRADIVPADWEP